MMKYLDLKKINISYEHAADEVLSSGWYLKGDYTRRFEEAYAAYIGTKYCIGCGNGLDALTGFLRDVTLVAQCVGNRIDGKAAALGDVLQGNSLLF